MRWVPYRFIRPFFPELKGLSDGLINKKIKILANESQRNTPYHFDKGHIVINDRWAEYLIKNAYIIQGFTQWHLLKFLQRNNGNVIGLTEKLIAPSIRNLTAAKAFWLGFMKHSTVHCIYQGTKLNSQSISLDHFIPWSYIAHDLIWNIVPTTANINSSKGNALPELSDYFESFSIKDSAIIENQEVIYWKITISFCRHMI